MAGETYTDTERALDRLAFAARNLAENGYRPGADVSMIRALRELHRCLCNDEAMDPRRLMRGVLFHGVSEMDKWKEGSK